MIGSRAGRGILWAEDLWEDYYSGFVVIFGRLIPGARLVPRRAVIRGAGFDLRATPDRTARHRGCRRDPGRRRGASSRPARAAPSTRDGRGTRPRSRARAASTRRDPRWLRARRLPASDTRLTDRPW